MLSIHYNKIFTIFIHQNAFYTQNNNQIFPLLKTNQLKYLLIAVPCSRTKCKVVTHSLILCSFHRKPSFKKYCPYI